MGKNNTRGVKNNVQRVELSKARKRFMLSGRIPDNTTAVEDMLSGSASVARNVRVQRPKMRLTDGNKYPVTVRYI